jgi:hypothetical protein
VWAFFSSPAYRRIRMSLAIVFGFILIDYGFVQVARLANGTRIHAEVQVCHSGTGTHPVTHCDVKLADGSVHNVQLKHAHAAGSTVTIVKLFGYSDPGVDTGKIWYLPVGLAFIGLSALDWRRRGAPAPPPPN